MAVWWFVPHGCALSLPLAPLPPSFLTLKGLAEEAQMPVSLTVGSAQIPLLLWVIHQLARKGLDPGEEFQASAQQIGDALGVLRQALQLLKSHCASPLSASVLA